MKTKVKLFPKVNIIVYQLLVLIIQEKNIKKVKKKYNINITIIKLTTYCKLVLKGLSLKKMW